MAKSYNHRRAEKEYKKWKVKDERFMVKIESQNTIKIQRLSASSTMMIRMKKRHDVTDNVVDFINRLIIHIPDYHFLTTRYYGFYANASKKTLDKVHALLGIKKNKDYSRETRTKALKNKLNKLKYRTHLIDSFNRDPIQCKCGAIMQYTYTYNPLEDKRNDRTYRKRCIDEMHKMRLRRRST